MLISNFRKWKFLSTKLILFYLGWKDRFRIMKTLLGYSNVHVEALWTLQKSVPSGSRWRETWVIIRLNVRYGTLFFIRTILQEHIGSKSLKIRNKLWIIPASDLMTQCKIYKNIEPHHIFSLFIKNNIRKKKSRTWRLKSASLGQDLLVLIKKECSRIVHHVVICLTKKMIFRTSETWLTS